MKKIILFGEEYILLDGGAITTADRLANYRPSYAHFYEELGVIFKEGKPIGKADDIYFGDEIPTEAQAALISSGMTNITKSNGEFNVRK